MENKKSLRALPDPRDPMVPTVVLFLNAPLYGKNFLFLFKPVGVEYQSPTPKRVLTDAP